MKYICSNLIRDGQVLSEKLYNGVSLVDGKRVGDAVTRFEEFFLGCRPMMVSDFGNLKMFEGFHDFKPVRQFVRVDRVASGMDLVEM